MRKFREEIQVAGEPVDSQMGDITGAWRASSTQAARRNACRRRLLRQRGRQQALGTTERLENKDSLVNNFITRKVTGIILASPVCCPGYIQSSFTSMVQLKIGCLGRSSPAEDKAHAVPQLASGWARSLSLDACSILLHADQHNAHKTPWHERLCPGHEGNAIRSHTGVPPQLCSLLPKWPSAGIMCTLGLFRSLKQV